MGVSGIINFYQNRIILLDNTINIVMSQEPETYPEIDDETHNKICELCELGDELAEQQNWAEAIANYNLAFELIPEPADSYSAATWIYTAIGDAYFLSGDYENARNEFKNALLSASGIENSFIQMRYGQSLLETGDIERAENFLAQVYLAEGEEIFTEEDPKYMNFLKTIIDWI